ncbi:MAG: radical SAM protein [Nitrospirae bacterium]|nr:radical SAM protein [Nitrospirota bacterium]
MPNILLTQRCVRSCPYCFAKKYMAEQANDDFLSWENLIYLTDFMEASGQRHVSLLGGEPTLHPDFTAYVIYLLERNFHVNVFTSGIMTNQQLEEAAHILGGVHEERLSFVCNLNDPRQTNTPMAETESVKRFLGHFGNRTSASFNIYRSDFNMDFLFQYINEFGLKRHIRLGIANPIPGNANRFITPDKFDVVMQQLLVFAPVAERLRIKFGFDCGFPMCKLDDSQLGWLFRNTGGAPSFGCGPAIDIGPDMTVWSCFPLANYHKRSIFEFNSLDDVIKFYEHKTRTIRIESGGIYEECDTCLYREDGKCAGGCLSHMLSAFNNEARVRLPDIYQ